MTDENLHSHTISISHSHWDSAHEPHEHGVDTFAFEIPVPNTDPTTLDGYTVVIDPDPVVPESLTPLVEPFESVPAEIRTVVTPHEHQA